MPRTEAPEIIEAPEMIEAPGSFVGVGAHSTGGVRSYSMRYVPGGKQALQGSMTAKWRHVCRRNAGRYPRPNGNQGLL